VFGSSWKTRASPASRASGLTRQGSRFMLTISIKQLYPGHAKQVGLVASQCQSGAYANRLTVVVDEDIDPGTRMK